MSEGDRKRMTIWDIIGRTMVLYLVIWGLSLAVPVDSAVRVAKLRTLNRLMPPLSNLVKSSLTQEPLDPKELAKYEFYYRKVTEYMPQNANGYYVQGYCLARMGKSEKAKEAYHKSIDRNPQFFWAHYNLALLYFKGGEYEQASASFTAALQTRPELSLKMILSSKVFQQLMLQTSNPGPMMTAHIKQAYADSQRLRGLSEHLKKTPKEPVPEEILKRLPARIF